MSSNPPPHHPHQANDEQPPVPDRNQPDNSRAVENEELYARLQRPIRNVSIDASSGRLCSHYWCYQDSHALDGTSATRRSTYSHHLLDRAPSAPALPPSPDEPNRRPLAQRQRTESIPIRGCCSAAVRRHQPHGAAMEFAQFDQHLDDGQPPIPGPGRSVHEINRVRQQAYEAANRQSSMQRSQRWAAEASAHRQNSINSNRSHGYVSVASPAVCANRSDLVAYVHPQNPEDAIYRYPINNNVQHGAIDEQAEESGGSQSSSPPPAYSDSEPQNGQVLVDIDAIEEAPLPRPPRPSARSARLRLNWDWRTMLRGLRQRQRNWRVIGCMLTFMFACVLIVILVGFRFIEVPSPKTTPQIPIANIVDKLSMQALGAHAMSQSQSD